jgi:hypothetical protein
MAPSMLANSISSRFKGIGSDTFLPSAIWRIVSETSDCPDLPREAVPSSNTLSSFTI